MDSNTVRLYRLYRDGSVCSFPELFSWMSHTEAKKLASSTPSESNQIGWGVAWGYPERPIQQIKVR